MQDPYALRCPDDDSLPRTIYDERQLTLRPFPGMWRFIDWLPVDDVLPGTHSGPVSYRSEGLARELGLSNLYISFNGYWPERGAGMLTCSFKELEALPTMRRISEQGQSNVLVVASAGNTGRAFSYVASLTGQPAVVLVPSVSAERVWLPGIERRRVALITVDGDYYDAIALSDRLAAMQGYFPEGGARNVARRDGMGTVMLDAVQTMGVLPRHYFQAVGSGTGGISAYEASARLLSDGRFGSTAPVLHLAQNLPCAPLFHARTGGSYPRECPEGIYDDVLFNRRPPYALPGGVGEALDATGGEIVGITNDEAAEARRLFAQTEGIDILPAPAVAVAALRKATLDGAVGKDKLCLLNITGGGEARVREDHAVSSLRADLRVPKDQDVNELDNEIRALLEVR